VKKVVNSRETVIKERALQGGKGTVGRKEQKKKKKNTKKKNNKREPPESLQ